MGADAQHVIYQVEYQRAVKTQIQAILEQLQADEFETVSEYLTKSYEEGFLGAMYSLHNQGMPFIFPIDQAQVVKAIQHDTHLTSSLYTALGLDLTKLKKTISHEISRGIASNMLYPEITGNVRRAAGIPYRRARTIVRTEGGRIQEQATMDAAYKAVEKGADLVKQWSAIRDMVTRDTHRQLDGQIREIEEPFEVGGKTAMQPHGFGLAEEDIHCRCTTLLRARDALDEEEYERLQDIARQHGLLVDDSKKYGHDKAKDFADFKKKYLRASDDIADKMVKASKIEANGLFVNKTEKLHRYAKNIAPLEGYEDFTCHADADNFYIDLGGKGNEEDFFTLSPEEYAERIKASPTYKGGNVRIISCQAGAKKDGAAQRLANALNVNVYAPTETVHVTENGEIFISDNDILAEIWYNEGGESLVKPTGEWRLFRPRKE